MYTRRSPGSGIRSNSLGMGPAASRISPEGAGRGRGTYNLEHRNFNRSFGRSPPKPYPPPLPPRRGDIFMEAGRLAAEYLVSQGLLSPNLLSSNWQNGSLKSQVGDFQEFRENLPPPPEGRTSALTRLGNIVPDAASGSRRFPDKFNQTGSRNYMRGRRRMGPIRSHGSDWSDKSGSSGSWLEKARYLPDQEAEDDFTSGDHEEQRVGLDASTKVISNELPLTSDIAGDSESELENYEIRNDEGSKASTSSTRKEVPPETDMEISKGSNDSGVLNAETIDEASNFVKEKQDPVKDFSVQQGSAECDPVNKNDSDLLRLCSFAKIPTKTRSSLTSRGSKADSVSITEEGNTCDVAVSRGPKAPMEEGFIGGSLSDTLTGQTQSSTHIEPIISRSLSVQSMENVGDLSSSFSVERGKCTRSQSFPGNSPFVREQESNQGPPGFGISNSMVKEKGEKRVAQHDDLREGTKKPREWPPSMVMHTDDYFDIHNLSIVQSSPNKESPPDDERVEAVDQANLVDAEGAELREEKQLFPNLFKICDLNLIESSDMSENNEDNLVLGLPSTVEAKRKVSMDVDISISNNCNWSDDYDRHSTDAKEVSIIDVENNSGNQDQALGTLERKVENVYSSLESFPNHMESTGDLPDVHDGYGLMISEMLGADISNCSSVPTDIADLHTEMGLHNGEGILGDDDPIYLSLGEIPISMPDI